MSPEAICRNCGNTGYDMFHRPCRCKAGRALVQMAEAYAVMADETVTSSEPRAIIRHFAAAMERKLAANDGVKGGWRVNSAGLARIERCDDLLKALEGEIREMRIALADVLMRVGSPDDLLDEAADCANFLAMICDVCGALPPTDERGR